jgi:hypothetical protein
LRADPDRERELLASLEEMNRVWRERDLAGALALFAPDGDYALFGSDRGETAHGPDELRRLLEHFFAEALVYSWTWHRRDASAIGDVGWVMVEATIDEVGGGVDLHVPYRISGVLHRIDGRWYWRLFHGSVPDESAVDFRRIVGHAGSPWD